jgi:Ca2+-binding RTX toxin-like protein
LIGGGEADTFDGGTGSDTIDYSTLSGDRGVNVNLSANEAEDDGFGSRDSLFNFENVIGSMNDDTIIGNSVDNLIWGLAGDDTIDALAGNDIVYGNDGVDTLKGGDGDDLIDGGAGNDVIDGGSGKDRVTFTDATTGVFVKLADGVAGTASAIAPDGTTYSEASVGTDSLSDVEGAIGTSWFDLMVGNDAENVFNGMGGDDVLRGNGGNDLLNGGEGTDLLEGGTGDDVLVGGKENDIAFGGAGNDLIINGTVGEELSAAGDTVHESLGDDRVLNVNNETTADVTYDGVATPDAFVNNLLTLGKLKMLEKISNTLGGTRTSYDVE